MTSDRPLQSASKVHPPTCMDAEVWLRLLADAQLSRAIQVVASLGIADYMTGGPQPPELLASRTSCDAEMLGRLLRYLAFAGVFEESGGHYSLTPLSRLLRSDEPGGLRERLSIGADGRALWWSTGELMHSVLTGQPAFDHVYGQSLWESMRAGGASSAAFQLAMKLGSEALADDLLMRYDWSLVRTVADLGGGTGTVLARLLSAKPDLRGILVDRPSVIPEAERTLLAAGVADRCDAVPGDLFDKVPDGADRYLLMRVIHDWTDKDAVAMLRTCREACGSSGAVLVVDIELGPHDVLGEGLASDIQMMLLVGGKERRREELAAILAESGFNVTARTELRAPYVVIEARPAQVPRWVRRAYPDST